MDTDVLMQLAIDEYFAYLEMLSQRGMQVTALPEDALRSLPLRDVRVLVDRLKQLARTPTPR